MLMSLTMGMAGATEPEKAAVYEVAGAGNPVEGYYFIGTIGGDQQAYLSMPSGGMMNGEYKFINYTRKCKFGSYNPQTRTLTILAYENGSKKYIGKFVGKVSFDHWGCPFYKGVFTNYKGGKVNFNLEAICD